METGLSQAEGFARKLTLVSAPAGYGKTTLIAAWLGEKHSRHGMPDETQSIAWLSLDEGDNDPTLFLSYLITTLRRVDDRIGGTALSILQSPQPPPVQTALTTWINDLAATTRSIFLVLDDYHVIHTPPIHQHLTFLLDHLPPRLPPGAPHSGRPAPAHSTAACPWAVVGDPPG